MRNMRKKCKLCYMRKQGCMYTMCNMRTKQELGYLREQGYAKHERAERAGQQLPCAPGTRWARRRAGPGRLMMSD